MKDGEIYKKRILDAVLARKLSGAGAVLVEGPKWCGKTTTCEQHAKSALYMADPVRRDRYRVQAETDITELMKGEQPRLIDEWQDAPRFWDAIRYDVDHSAGWGHYILTGSAVPPDDKNERSGKKAIVHSGTGRIVRVRMRPMSLWESEESSGTVSLGALFKGEQFKPCRAVERSLAETAYLVCRGGWPQAISQDGETALDRAFEYVDAVVNSDLSRVDGVSRDPRRARLLLKSYARLQGTQSTIVNIRKDMTIGDGNGLECDAVVHLRNGTSGLVEVKLGGESLIEEGARTLNDLSGILDSSRQREVAFKMVVTATGDCAYQRKDGIIVCPISCLKP